MTTSKKITTTELGFDGIKQSLRTFLEGQTEFSDYNFEGSGLSILLDVLAYNTHYNALYTNLAINEAFLDSASKRASVVSKAKELGYTPKSSRSAAAIVNVLMLDDRADAPLNRIIPAYTSFLSHQDGGSFSFYTTEDRVAVKSGNAYRFDNVVIKEGVVVENDFLYTNGARIIIPNAKADVDTFSVLVQQSANSSEYEVFSQSNTILNLTGDSQVYFVSETEDGLYELKFGNGVYGKQLQEGNVINVKYLVCSEDGANGSRNFTYSGGTPNNVRVFVTTIQAASGGSGPEDIESIRWNAPRLYSTQGRCVTAEDYVNIIKSYDPTFRAIRVWGGEENNPPEYGRVFISIVKHDKTSLTSGEKNALITNVLTPRKSLTITPIVVDPTYVYVELDCVVYYNPALTLKTAGDITTLVRRAVQEYDDAVASRFGGTLRFTKLTTEIDNVDPSITGNNTNVMLRCHLLPVYNRTSQYKVELNNSIQYYSVPNESVLSSGIYVTDVPNVCYIDDIPGDQMTGALRLFYVTPDGEKVQIRIVGEVDYKTGLIKIGDLAVTQLASPAWHFKVKPNVKDVTGSRGQLVTIDMNSLKINLVADAAVNSTVSAQG